MLERSWRVRALTRLTLWLVGLLVALMTGTLSAYAVLTVLYVASTTLSRLRARAASGRLAVGRGDRG